MGGARCSYRTCTVRSDKMTHMFHFPVFDKIRCHQWITNAQKLNFLNLKLSQLKNRVICEHHFTDDAFMNVMKAKLKNTAVPTKDGPFCTTVTASPQAGNRELPINIEDIENDYLTNMDKKAHFSVKYSDFLTNDIAEPINLIPHCNMFKGSSLRLQDNETINTIIRDYNLRTPKNTGYFEISYNGAMENKVCDVKTTKTASNEKTALSDASTLFQNKLLPNPKVVAIEYEDLNLNSTDQTRITSQIPQEQSFSQPKIIPKVEIEQTNTPLPKGKKVKIISEKKISEPLCVNKSELQTVSPSSILKPPDRKKRANVEMNGSEIQTFYIDLVPSQSQQLDNNIVQEFNNSSIMSKQPNVSEQMYLNEYAPSIRVGEQDFSNRNIELLVEPSKPAEIITSEAYEVDKMNMKQLDLLNDLQNISILPEEYPPTSSTNAPCVFTLSTDVPEDSTLLTSSSYVHNVTPTPEEAQNSTLLSQNSETGPGLSQNIQQNAKNITDVSKNPYNDHGTSNNTHKIILNKQLPSLSSSPSLNKKIIKNKMPPEKLAAIEEKRKFNMKLRDIINSCLNNLNEEPDLSKLSAAMKKKLPDKKVGEHLSKDPRLPNNQENNIAYFEARLQRMEDILLNKIDQNSQKIADLKRTIKPPSGKKSAFTQTSLSAGLTKKYLYQQISQYLSPEAKSLIYEELFLNEYVDSISNTEPSPKKRRRKT